MTPERWQRIKEVFECAAELRPEDRELYLAAETSHDTELRQEVDRMLRYATGPGLLDKPAWEGLRLEGRLEQGMRLGPYEILEQVGAGGMARVYKARDIRLGRTVAIKVLSPEFRHRLRLEGRAISALNHPHVCALYDIGDHEGAAYLVMEYLEGESLAACLSRGPLPLDEVLRYGAEIAGALEAAHAEGIVHRDLKPANIMLMKSGAKVLDFGVAQMAQDEETPAGGVAGTAAYMSPSQWNGNPAGARSDIFALGLVLYEMSTGARYSRQSPKPLADVPAGLASLIEDCLQDDAARRVQSMAEVRATLERLRSATAQSARPRWTRPLRTAAVLAATLGAMAATALLTWNVTRRDPPHPPAFSATVPTTRPETARPSVTGPLLTVSSPAPVLPPPPAPPSLAVLASYPGMERDPAFSPDGKSVAFSWHHARSGYRIYVRSVKPAGQPVQLTEGDGEDWGPAWSPDSRTLAFRRKAGQSGIYLVPASGGPANLLAPIARQGQETLPQMSWSRDGKWLAAPDRDSNGVTQIYLFATRSGEKRAMTFNTSGTAHAPAFSPDGKSLAYASCLGATYPCDVYVIDLRRDYLPGAARRITDEGVYIRGIAWLPNGRSLVYSAGRAVSTETFLWRVSLKPPSLPERIDMAGSQARHPAISMTGGLLAYTRLNGWKLMTIENFH